MRALALIIPLLALLGATLWFVAYAWRRLGAAEMPDYGWAALGGGVAISLLVGCGLMALLFYSHRHGYDAINQGDRRNEEP
ncbi:MAG: hypothetical protein JOZ70_03720 [Pseudolabrys sp.]|nr:hypothetical protein [Pseudolabrys sp.]